ncbi:MAG: efflux RND transporter permease subunit [Burkholderiales bacterium]
MWFTRVSLGNPVFATMLMAGLLVLGLFSYGRLSVEQFPNVEFPVVIVNTQYPGASPEVIESDITRKIEEGVNTISGLKTLTSRSYEGQSLVIAEFDLLTDAVVAAQDVREKVAGVKAQFRKEVEEPVVSRFNPEEMPILSLAVNSDRLGLRELTLLADQVITKRIESARGVGRVTLVGGARREVQISLRPPDMEALGVGVDQVMRAIRDENQDLPAGSLSGRESERLVKVQGRIESVRQFRDVIVARRSGSPVHLWQVAQVADGQAEEESVAIVNGQRGLALDIVKAQSANTLDVVAGVHEVVRELEKSLPAGVRITVVRDTSTGIRNSVSNVRQTIVEGGLLTVLIVFLFLRSWRSTIITGLTLPISLIGTFTAMLALGYSLNVMTLMAMSLCVGLLIDDAIVVRENIVRHALMGKSHYDAAYEGTREIGLAVLATTFTICAVFVPVAFMGGIIGRFFYPFGMTVTAAVLLSMLVSFTLDPMLSSVWVDPDASGRRQRGPVGWVLETFERGFQAVSRFYQALVQWSIGHRKSVVVIAIGSFTGSFLLVPLIGSEFVPEADLSEILIQLNTASGSSLEFTERKVLQAESALREFPEVSFTYSTVNTGFVLGKNYATVFVRLKPRQERALSQKALAHPFRERLQRVAGIEVTYVGPYSSISSGKPLQVSIQGTDIAVLERLSRQVMAILRGIPGPVDLDSSLKAAKPMLEVKLDREGAADLGVGVAQVAAALRPLIAGEAVSTWKAPDAENYDVRVRLPQDERRSQADLDRLRVASAETGADGAPKLVPLRQIAAFLPTVGPTQINRRDLHREVLVTANVHGRPAGDVGGVIKEKLAEIALPPGYRFVMGGSTKDIAETSRYAGQALLLAVVFIYLILASQFRSFLQPFAIMVSLPLSLIGVLGALLLWGSTLNIFSIIGFIMLMGLVTKNAILLVDFVNQAVSRGVPREQAIVEAARVRLRPILMTTAAMVFGMLPLALGLGEGSEQRAPMAHAVIGGVIASTLLTLLVVPVAYTYLDDLARWVKGRRAAPAVPAAGTAVVLDGPQASP